MAPGAAMWLKQRGQNNTACAYQHPACVSVRTTALFPCSSHITSRGQYTLYFPLQNRPRGFPGTRLPEQLAVSRWRGKKQEIALNVCWGSDTSAPRGRQIPEPFPHGPLRSPVGTSGHSG